MIAALAAETAPVALDALAADVAAREARFGDADGNSVDDVVVSLHHSHLPKLADAGLLDYDRASNRVESVAVTADFLVP